MKQKLSDIVVSILIFFKLHRSKKFRNICYGVDFLWSEGFNIGKGTQHRHEIMFKFSEQFVRYIFSTPNLSEKEALLKKNLDAKSRKTIDTTINRYQYIYAHNMIFLDDISNTDDEFKEYLKVEDYLSKIKKKYTFPIEFNLSDESNVFYYKKGLTLVPRAVLKKNEGTDFIDAGAFIGDSALIFAQEFNPGRIYSFEPSAKNYKLLVQTIKLNTLTNVVPIKMGIGDKITTINMKYEAAGSYINDEGDEKIDVITIDSFVKKNRLHVGVIKMDIEGYELKAIKKAEETIKKYKPVLLISIYHTGVDFFEIKPLIERWVPGYKFIIRKLNPLHPTFEVTLIGYYQN